MKPLYTLLLTLALLVSTPRLTLAQQAPCYAPDPAIVGNLYNDHGESRVFAGLTKQGEVLHVFLNPKTGSFTILVSNGDIVCEASQGSGGETTKPRQPGEKDS